MNETLRPYKIIDNQILDGNFTTAPTNILKYPNVAMSVQWDGYVAGDFSVEVSVDGSLWVPLPDITATADGSQADAAFFDLDTNAAYVRLVFEDNMGDGYCSAAICAK